MIHQGSWACFGCLPHCRRCLLSNDDGALQLGQVRSGQVRSGFARPQPLWRRGPPASAPAERRERTGEESKVSRRFGADKQTTHAAAVPAAYDVLVPVSRSGERARQASINSPCLDSSWGIEHPMQEPRFAFHWIGGRMRQSLELGFPGPGGERARKNCQLDNGSRL